MERWSPKEAHYRLSGHPFRTIEIELTRRTGLTGVRWRIVSLLFAFSVIGYIERVNMSIAGELMMREFNLTPVQLGWVLTAFLVSYTAFQTPSGAWADRLGPRLVLGAAGVAWGLLTILTALLPGMAFTSAAGVLASLLAVRFLMGISEAPTYPAAGRAIANWIPLSERGFSNGFVISGALLGTAITSPLIASLMVHLGWRNALVLTSLLGPGITLAWMVCATDHPGQHRGVSAEELELINATATPALQVPPQRGAWKVLLKSGEAWKLFLAYGCEGYLSYVFIFWSYHYLVEIRHFSLASGGFVAAIPFLLSTFTTPAMGMLSDWLTLRLGQRLGRRLIPVIAMPSAAVAVLLGVYMKDARWAVAFLSVGAALNLAPEGPSWASMMEIASPVAGAAGGFLNTGGNLIGALATFLTPWIAQKSGWTGAFGVACLLAIMGSILWMTIDPTRLLDCRMTTPETA